MGEICEKHGVLKRSCYICDMEEENLLMRSALKGIAEPSIELWKAYKQKHGEQVSFQEYLKSIARETLEQI